MLTRKYFLKQKKTSFENNKEEEVKNDEKSIDANEEGEDNE
jgi:hypothetical protein